MKLIWLGLITVVFAWLHPMHLMAQQQLLVRLGVVTYEDFQDQDGELRRLLERLSSTQNPPVQFQITAGSYREVTHWLGTGELDVALLTSGGYVRGVLQTELVDEFEYLATMDAGTGEGPWVTSERKADGFQRYYHSVAITHASNDDWTPEELRTLLETGQLKVFLVHPQSASGAQVPLLALKQIGIDLPEKAVQYMYSHTQVLESVARQAEGTKTLGFVWDDAIAKHADLETKLKQVHLPVLNSVKIPHDVLIASRQYPQLEAFKELLEKHAYSEAEPLFLSSPDGNQEYLDLEKQIRPLEQESNQLLVRQDLQGVGQLLAHAQKNATEFQPFRLAVVLSGGGARCAYQVGAISAVEDYLAELNSEYGSNLDIDLVVGTSGGALNAVPVSMKVSTYPAGQTVWRDVWTSLDRRKIIKPSIAVRINAGIWFAFLQMTVVYLLSRLFKRQYATRLKFFYRICLCLGAIEFALIWIPFEPWVLLGHNQLLHHLWLWCQLGSEYTALAMLFCGAIYYFVSKVANHPNRSELKIKRGRIHWILTVGVLGLPLLQFVTMLIYEKTFSTSDGIRASLADGYSTMLEAHARHHDLDLRLDRKSPIDQRLQEMGQWIATNKVLSRDLVLTTTAIDRSRAEIPSELYFYLQANSESPKPEFGNRGIDMAKSPQQFMNIVLGSSAIYPVFPGQEVRGMPNEGDALELVDGGFAHNAPVEAAVLWGASHVLLVDVSPLKNRDGVNLADSVIRGFGHLLRQSQLSDQRSRSEVVVVNLQSRFEPALGVIDFSSNLIANGIEHGYQDATGKVRLERHDNNLVELPPFVVSYGQPEFQNLIAPAKLPEKTESKSTPEVLENDDGENEGNVPQDASTSE